MTGKESKNKDLYCLIGKVHVLVDRWCGKIDWMLCERFKYKTLWL